MGQHFFESLLAIMAISLATTVMLRRINLPSIVAYLFAGVLVGPGLFGLVDDPSNFSFLAEFGVVFLLFALGLEFSLPKLISLRRSVFGLGGAQVIICTVLFALAVWIWGTSISAAVLIAGALALSSTAIVTKELGNLHQVQSRHGQLSIGVLLFQDLAAIVFLILVPVLAGQATHSLWQTLGNALLKTIFLLAILLSIGKWVLPLFYKEVSRSRSDEIFVLTTLVIVMLAAWITHSFHLSMALGGFVIGMMLSESAFRHQIEADIRPFKDILLGLFFVTIGMNVEVALIWEYWPRLLAFTVGLILIKALLITTLVRLAGDNRKVALQTGLNLAQAGEFGLALLSLAVMQNIIPNDQASFIILVSIFSMAASPFLIHHGEAIANKLGFILPGAQPPPAKEEALNIPTAQHIIIGGFGRVGKTVARLLNKNSIDYIAIDNSIDQVNSARKNGENVIYGDCSSLDILRRCHIEQAEVAILTFSSIEYAKKTIDHIRSASINTAIIVRCKEHGNIAELVSLGANHVIPEMLEASLVIAAQMLTHVGIHEDTIKQQIANERIEQLGR